MNTEKILIYTGLFNSYDYLTVPLFNHKNIEYICFTNNHKLKSKNWKIIHINEKGTGVYLNRKVKILPHIYLSNYKNSIYIDANVVLTIHPLELITLLLDNNFVVFQHPNKHNFLNEIKDNYKNKRIDYQDYNKIIKSHSNFIFFNPQSTKSIFTNRILIRNHKNKDVIKLMNNWWHQFSTTKIYRDQLILPYLLSSHTCKIKIIIPKLTHITYYVLKPHKNQSNLLKLKYFLKFSIYEFIVRIMVKLKNIV
jgi:hypothetical protein